MQCDLVRHCVDVLTALTAREPLTVLHAECECATRRQGRDPTCPFCNSVIHLEVKYRLPWTGLTAEVRRARAPRLSLPLLMVFFPARCVFNCLKYFKVVDQVHIFMAAPCARPAAAGQCLLTRRLHVQEQALAWAVQ